MDRPLLAAYSLTGIPFLDCLAGTLVLALMATVVGEFTVSVAYRVNRRHLHELGEKVARLHRVSHNALEAGDRSSYRLINREANDAFGRLFFQKAALSAASLWPIFFALEWMQENWPQVGAPLPGASEAVNYVAAFLVCYVTSRLLFGRVKRRLPYFKGVYRLLDAGEPERKATPGQGRT
jgi:hypothetical protein